MAPCMVDGWNPPEMAAAANMRAKANARLEAKSFQKRLGIESGPGLLSWRALMVLKISKGEMADSMLSLATSGKIWRRSMARALVRAEGTAGLGL